LKVHTGIKAGVVLLGTSVNIERVASSVANLVKGQNALVIDWAKSMHQKSNQLWSALTGQ
jgi:hypothetical protein